MRISTGQYLRRLDEMAANLREVVAILGKAEKEQIHWLIAISFPQQSLLFFKKNSLVLSGPIRQDSDEGQMGARAKEELASVEKLTTDLREISTSNISVVNSTADVVDNSYVSR